MKKTKKQEWFNVLRREIAALKAKLEAHDKYKGCCCVNEAYLAQQEIDALKAERDRALEILSEVPSIFSVFHTSPCPGWNIGKDCDVCRIVLFGQQAAKPEQEKPAPEPVMEPTEDEIIEWRGHKDCQKPAQEGK